MPTALVALLCFIGVLIAWTVLVKRSMAEAMFLGFVTVCLFGGTDAFALAVAGLRSSASDVVVYAAVGFVFMAYLIDQLGIMKRILDLLNSMFGRVRGGPAYVDTVGSGVMGALAGSNAGNAAATGAVTTPWMIESGFSPKRSATIVAGNSAMGAALPPSNSMVIMLGFASGIAASGSVYIALFVSGIYQLAYRFLLVAYFARRDGIERADPSDIHPLATSWRFGWRSIAVYLGAVIPVALTVGPIANHLSERTAVGDALGSVSIMVWIPTLIIVIACLVGRKNLPRTRSQGFELVRGAMQPLSQIGALLFFAIAASTVFVELGLAGDVEAVLGAADLPPWLVVVIVSVTLAVVCGPLTGAPTVATLGQVSLLTLIAAGIDPVIAVIVVLMATSTEGQSPPASAPIFIAAALARTRPQSLFTPLIGYYLLPVLLMTILVGLGVLPVPTGG
ncbi:TRAP transporter large permease subunit [Pseudonocardia nematodicida]|uniref:TRAP transporter large permease subunit n=1 Tax=Pseudonocardia nematodicida TaxID=1206997 RepID=A0ABV1KDT7_9PSEU